MSPDERVGSDFFQSSAFRFGVTRRKWSLLRIDWPFAFVRISADYRKGPASYLFRIRLDGYPSAPPEFLPWNDEHATLLHSDQWPNGFDRVGTTFQFNGSNDKINIGCYWPGDRFGLRLHPSWAQDFPTQAWRADRDLSHCLEHIYELLNSPDYTGSRISQAPH